MSDPAVSVVIACFNYARWLPDSVGSVLSQTLTDLELLIVDDGSTDDSLAVARRLATGDPRVTVLAHPNAGQPAIPRNRAIERARGRYVVSLDADDRLSPTALEQCAAELDGDPRAGLAYLQRQDFGSSCELHPHLDWRVEQLKRANFLSSSAMFRRPAWEAAGGYSTNVRGYEDWDLWLGIAEAGFTGRRTLGALFYYRRHEGGVYSESTDGDQRLKAQVVVNRSGMFGDGVLGWARGVLAGDPDALDVPEQLGVVPVIPDPPHPFRIARDRAERADWYVDVDGLDGPWPSRSLPESLSIVDQLGYTTVRAGGAPAAHKRATDPIVCPVPFFITPTGDRERAGALAIALEEILVAGVLRAGTALDAGRAAAYLGVPASDLAGLVSMAQALMRDGGPVPVELGAPIRRIAGMIRSQLALDGDGDGACRAAELERAAARAGLEQARTVAILAFADELIAAPGLLAAYGATVSAADDVTLVIVADDSAPLIEAVANAGLVGEASADLLAVPAPPEGIHAVLSHVDYGGLPRFDESSLDALRAFVGSNGNRRSTLK